MIAAISAKPHPAGSAPPRDYISWSAITTYQQCPLRYYFRYIEGLPEPTISSSLVFGTAIHRAVEHHFRELLIGNEPPCLEALMGEYDQAWQDVDSSAIRFGKQDDLDSLGGLARKMLTAFQRSPLATSTGKILGIEESLRGAVIPGCPDLFGRIDLLTEEEDAIVITDLKTARTHWSQEQAEDSAGQLLLYHDLVRPLDPRKKLRLRFAVISKGKEPTVELHDVPASAQQIARTKQIVSRVWRAIAGGHFFPAPSAMNCPGCPFREPCRAWPE